MGKTIWFSTSHRQIHLLRTQWSQFGFAFRLVRLIGSRLRRCSLPLFAANRRPFLVQKNQSAMRLPVWDSPVSGLGWRTVADDTPYGRAELPATKDTTTGTCNGSSVI